MKVSKKGWLYISIAIIIIDWIYQIVFKETTKVLPSNLFDLVVLIGKVKIIHFLIVYALLRLQGENFEQLGFSKIKVLPQILRGAVFGVGIFFLANIILNSIILRSIFPTSSSNSTSMLEHFKDLNSVFVWIIIGIVGGGFVEEFERIFVITRFKNWLGNPGIFIALFIGSIAFGFSHLYQGTNNAITAGFAGLMNGLVYLRKGSAIEAITSHAVFDTLGILIGYAIMNHHLTH